jgi:hypothetical protein
MQKPHQLNSIVSKSLADKDIQGLDPKRPWASFDFNFDTILREGIEGNALNEARVFFVIMNTEPTNYFISPPPLPSRNNLCSQPQFQSSPPLKGYLTLHSYQL